MMDLKKGNTVVYKTNGMKITADGGFGLKSVDQIDSQLADLKRMYKQGGIHRRSPLGAEVRLVAPVAGMMQKRAPLADYYGAQELERLAKIRWGGGPKPESKAYQVPDVPKLRSHWGWQGYPSRPSINGPVTRVPRPVEIIGPTKPTAVKPQVAPQPVQTPDKVPSSTPIEVSSCVWARAIDSEGKVFR
ncbi:hypothetical protein IE81DRAFT_181736 [Ceraceosorus guamensis]|uniref:Uncharacterized protein n=1 Tax=Ceraceosorus guamensis TaxID=1522189 RepID=A0A316VVD1_9BASI|nr:hypothetical protein IE81DRAFT_181736 [Ceraceosorus guamensis]PWN41244.1 hypothetical protein IE81DRAFT_181736 [Ceraceosorus guamensis]